MRCSWIYNQWLRDIWCIKWITKYLTRILLDGFDKCIKVWPPHHPILSSYQGSMSHYQCLSFPLIEPYRRTGCFVGEVSSWFLELDWFEMRVNNSALILGVTFLFAMIRHTHLPIYLHAWILLCWQSQDLLSTKNSKKSLLILNLSTNFFKCWEFIWP